MKTIITFLFSALLSFHCLQAQSVKTLDLETLKQILTQENDTLYVFNFWATWCAPCVKELPHFEELQANYKEKKVKVILVSLDFLEDLESRLIPFVEKRQLKSEVWLLSDADANNWTQQISKKWGGSIPATLLNMPSKGIYDLKEQSFTYEELESWVLTALE